MSDSSSIPAGMVKCYECGELTPAADGPVCWSCKARQPTESDDGLWRYNGDEWVATEKQQRLLLQLQVNQTKYLGSI